MRFDISSRSLSKFLTRCPHPLTTSRSESARYTSSFIVYIGEREKRARIWFTASMTWVFFSMIASSSGVAIPAILRNIASVAFAWSTIWAYGFPPNTRAVMISPISISENSYHSRSFDPVLRSWKTLDLSWNINWSHDRGFSMIFSPSKNGFSIFSNSRIFSPSCGMTTSNDIYVTDPSLIIANILWKWLNVGIYCQFICTCSCKVCTDI